MSRPLRIDYEGAWYHVVNRGRGRQAIFPGEAGCEAFRSWVLEQGGDASESPRWEWQRLYTADEVLAVVADEWGVDPESLTARGRQLGPKEGMTRQVAMLLCRGKTELALAAIGERFGSMHYSAVGQNIRGVQAAMRKDKDLERLYRTVMS